MGRLRMAIPVEVLTGAPHLVVGRRDMSAAAFKTTLATVGSVVHTMYGDHKQARCARNTARRHQHHTTGGAAFMHAADGQQTRQRGGQN